MKASHTFWSDAGVPLVEMRCTTRSTESYKPHSHKEFCVGAVTEGTVVLTVQGQSCVVSPGCLLLIPPGSVHSCNPQQGRARSYLMAYFPVPWCRSLQNTLFGGQREFVPPQRFLLECDELYRSFVELARLLPGDALTLEKSGNVTQFVGDLFARTCDREVPAPRAERDGLVQEVKEYLEQRADLNITLTELSATFRCNPYHLLRSFKKAVGLPPHAFMLNARIEKAKLLLLDGVPPAAVAAETGFADQSHFHKTFRRILAATPRQYQSRSVK